MPSVADAIMDEKELYDKLLQRLIDKLNLEYVFSSASFHDLSHLSVSVKQKLSSFQWKPFVDGLAQYAPLLLQVLSAIVTHKKKNVTTVHHHPKLCMAVAVLISLLLIYYYNT